MSTRREEYWTELHTIGTTTVIVEMTRFGLLWHGHGARVTEDKRIEPNALAVAWGADQEQVYQDVLKGVRYSLERRQSKAEAKDAMRKESASNGLYVMGTWRKFSSSNDTKTSIFPDDPPKKGA
jgi:hypothetical protein